MQDHTNQRAAKPQTPIVPQPLHELRANLEKAMPNPKRKKRHNIFAKSHDLREDRGTREMNTSHYAHPFHVRQFTISEKNPLKEGALTKKSAGLGTVTREMVRARAAELAVIDDHLSHEATASHFSQAKRELTGVPDTDPKDAILEFAPESERWDPVPGSTGGKVPVAPNEDEDDEGRSDNERLVEGGIAEAEIEQSFQATRAAAKEDL